MPHEGLNESSGISRGPDTGASAEFNWRNHQQPDTLAVGGENDPVSWHGALKEDLEELMDKIAAAAKGIDFLEQDGDPLSEMIAWGEEQGIVTTAEARELHGFYDPKGSTTYH